MGVYFVKILISSCLMGENVRYDGFNSSVLSNDKFSVSTKKIFANLLDKHEVFSFCPEVSAGLSTPRMPVEIFKTSPLKLLDKNGKDMTESFIKGAKNCLDLCKKEGIKVALLKAKSPSCGNEKTYDGTFTNTLIDGSGVCAGLLLKNGIKVFNENQMQEFMQFVEKS